MTSVDLRVTGDVREIVRDLRVLDRRLVPRAVNRGLVAAGRAVETVAVARIASRARVPKSRVRWLYTSEATKTRRRRLRKNNPARHAFAIDALTVRFAFSPFSVPLASLGRVRQTRTGARAGQHVIPGAFKADMGTGPHAWKRRGRKRWPATVQAVDLEPHVHGAFVRGLARGRSKFITETERQVAREFARRGFR